MPASTPDSATPFGRGLTADVYPWDNGKALKLFHPGTSLERVEHEFNVTRAVHGLGLPVPAVHDIVVKDDRHGIVMERIDGNSLFRAVQAKPWTMFQAVRQLADLHVRVNSCVAPASLPSLEDKFLERIEASTCMSDDEKQAARRQVKCLSDSESLCHGDFHPDNILITRQGPVIIDWSGATRGSASGDVATTCWLFHNADLPKDSPLYMRWMLAISRNLIHRGYVSRYMKSQLATPLRVAEWLALLSAVNRTSAKP